MTNNQIHNYLKQPYEEWLVHEIHLYLMNDSKHTPKLINDVVYFAKRKIKQGVFDKTQFVLAVKYNIDHLLKNGSSFMREYGKWLERKPTLAEKFRISKRIADYIIAEYL